MMLYLRESDWITRVQSLLHGQDLEEIVCGITISPLILVLVLTKSSKSKQVISMELYNPSIRETQDENEKIKSALNQVAKNILQ